MYRLEIVHVEVVCRQHAHPVTSAIVFLAKVALMQECANLRIALVDATLSQLAFLLEIR